MSFVRGMLRKQPGSGHCIALQPGSSGLGLTAASRAADNRRGWVANNGRHPVECGSSHGDREAWLRRMQRCGQALPRLIVVPAPDHRSIIINLGRSPMPV
jgi:hypothetical protein